MSTDAKKIDPIFVADGDTLVIVAKDPHNGPTVSDPCDASPYLSQAFRIVADRVGPTLALVPLGLRAVRVSQDEVDRFKARKHHEKMEEILTHLKNPALLVADVIEASGWKPNAPVIVDAKPFDPTGPIPGSPR